MIGVHRIQHVIQKLFGNDAAQRMSGGHLLWRSVGTFALRVSGIGLVFIQSLVLARLLGVEQYGVYEYVIAWINVLVLPAVFGLDQLLVRSIAAYQAQSEWGLMQGLYQWAFRVVLILSVGMTIVVGLIVWWLFQDTNQYLLLIFWMGCLLIPIANLSTMHGSCLRGLHRIETGLLPDSIIKPVLIITISLGAGFVVETSFNAFSAIGIYAIAVGIALVAGSLLLARFFPKTAKVARPIYQQRVWVIAAFPLMLTTSMTLINSRLNTILLGSFQDTAAVGIYTVARRITDVLPFTLVVANTVLAPTFASLYAQRDMEQLQHVVTRSARLVLLGTLPIAIGLVVFAPWVLRLFGPEFIQAQTALMILVAGQFVNIAMGSVALLLMMTDHASEAAIGMGTGVALNAILSVLLIPMWGFEGAAIASSVSLVLWNLVLAVWVYRRIGIHTTALGNIAGWLKGRKQ